MRSMRIGQAAALLFAALASPAPTAPAAAQLWQVDWEHARCTIATGDPASMYLALWLTPGDPEPELYLVAPAERLRGGGERVKLTLLPGGKPISAWTIVRPGQAGATVVQLGDLDENFPAAFAKASEVRVTGFAQPVAVRITGAGQAMAALRKCLDEKMAEWGLDPKAHNALRAPPIDPGNHDYLDDFDYPHEDQAAGKEGDVVARLSIDAKGRVTNCAVGVTSGSKPMDEVTCRKALRKGRFIPAVGGDGRPTAAMRTIRAKFRLATEETINTVR